MSANGSNLESSMHEEAAWLRRLAARLITDPALADDACQEAWLAAARKGLTERSDLRADLFRWMRRFAWRWRRAETRRSLHEQAARPGQEFPSTHELLSRAEERQRLWLRLTELPEPYRTTLLLRFQEGVDTSQIAKRFDCPTDTVRRRIRKGLSLLRERYARDSSGTGRNALALIAIPLTPRLSPLSAPISALGTTGTATAVGAWMMKKATMAVAITALLAGGLGVSYALDAGATNTPESPKTPTRTAALDPGARTETVRPGPQVRTERTPTEERLSTPNPESQCLVRGELYDDAGLPIVGGTAELVAGSDHWNATPIWAATDLSTATGAFAVTPAATQNDDPVRLRLRGSDFHQEVTIMFGPDSEDGRPRLTDQIVDVGSITLGPASVVTGRLLSSSQRPIEEAWIDDDQSSEFARSTPDGRFRLPRLTPGEHTISVKVAGYLVRRFDLVLPASRLTNLGDVVLEAAPRVQGVVTDSRGIPLLDAKVSTRGFTRGWVFETHDGYFDVPLPEDRPTRIYGRASGHEQSDGQRVTPGQSDVAIQLDPDSPRALFHIVDDRNGSAVRRFGVRLDYDDRLDGFPPRVRLYRTGRVSASCEPEDEFIEVHAPGYERTILAIDDTAWSEDGQIIRLIPAATLRGRLVGSDGEPAAGREVLLRFGRLGRVERGESEAPVPFDTESEVGQVFRSQGGFTIHPMTPIDEPLPPFVMSSFRPTPPLRCETSADGLFEFPVGRGTGRLFVLGTDAASTEVLAIDTSEGQDLGDVVLRDCSQLSIRLLPTPVVDVRECRLELGSLEDRFADLGDDGVFRFEELPPGAHWFRIRIPEGMLAPDLEWRSYFVRLEPGENRQIDLPIPVRPVCDLTVDLSFGDDSGTNAEVDFHSSGGESAGSISVNDSGSGSGFVEAGTPLGITVWIDGTPIDVPGSIVLPTGSSARRIELETASLELTLPEWFELPDEGQFELAGTLENGTTARPIRTRVDDNSHVLGASGEDLRIIYRHLPANVTRFELKVRSGGPYSEGEWQTLGSFPFEASSGEPMSVSLQ
ncbi:MAG: sigma-70 family RNA polymerase sigma factor [Planctomycetota bacterium]